MSIGCERLYGCFRATWGARTFSATRILFTTLGTAYSSPNKGEYHSISLHRGRNVPHTARTDGMNLPTRLKKEPLVDAVFEARFKSSVPGSLFLPGALLTALEGEKVIDRLPAGEIPSQMRDADPHLMHQPLLRINWNNFFILIGDRSVGVACRLPYPGWAVFRPAIIGVLAIAQRTEQIEMIERHSIRYIDILEGADLAKQIGRINFSVQIGKHQLQSENFNVRVEIVRDDVMHAVQIAGPTSIQTVDGAQHGGVVLDIDTVEHHSPISPELFADGLDGKLDRLHRLNKEMFFECLRPETVEFLEPEYE